MQSPAGPPRRRNGRQQACEPCRRRKVACDHALPTCTRCRRGNIASKCVYLVGGRPLVTPAHAQTHGYTSSLSSPTTLHPSGSHGSHVVSHHSAHGGTHHSSHGSTHHSRHDHRDSTRSPPAPTRPEHVAGQGVAYLGATSFSAVFEETRSNLIGVNVGGQHGDTTPGDAAREHGSSCQTPNTPASAPGDKVNEVGIRILQNIPTKASSYYLLKIHVNPNDGWVRLAAHRLLDSIWETFGPQLEGERSDRDLSEMAHLLSRNSSCALAEDALVDIPGSRGDEWLAGFTGKNLRWEALGVLFTYWSFGTISLTENDATVECKKCYRSDRRRLWRAYKDSAWKCIELTRDEGVGSALCAYLLYKHVLLQTNVDGDAAMQCWRLMGECVAMATFLGLHVVPHSVPGTYSVAQEVRRRVFASIFMLDKVFSTFTGRPPLLSRRYISSQPPLDISDETLLDEPPERWCDNLDENGWNREGRIYSTTIARARRTMLIIQDEILELALNAPHANVVDLGYENLMHLKEKAMTAAAQLPQHLTFSPGDVKDPFVDAPSLYTRLLIRLEHLGNLFLIERLLDKYHPEHATRLLDIAFEMVSLTLVFWTHKDRLAGLQGDFEWLVMSCAAPAGGILCTELLKPSPRSRDPNHPTASRSSIIQQLSLLVGFLDWVGPTAPNGDLCSSTKNVIKHVLDVALNPAADVSGLLSGAGDWDVDFSVDLNDFFNFQLLDTFDWLRPEDNKAV